MFFAFLRFLRYLVFKYLLSYGEQANESKT